MISVIVMLSVRCLWPHLQASFPPGNCMADDNPTDTYELIIQCSVFSISISISLPVLLMSGAVMKARPCFLEIPLKK